MKRKTFSFSRLSQQKEYSLRGVIGENIAEEYVFIIESQASITLCDYISSERSMKYTCIIHEQGNLTYQLDARRCELPAIEMSKRSITCCLEGISSQAIIRCRYEGRGTMWHQLETVQHHKAADNPCQ